MPSIDSFLNPIGDGIASDEARFEWQMEWRANYILIGDQQPHVVVDTYVPQKPAIKLDLTWIKRGELIAGSYLCNLVPNNTPIKHNDIDIYFKSKEDALEFCKVNRSLRQPSWALPPHKSQVGFVVQQGSDIYNLIFGVEYESAEDLVSRFDIRACSIAYDPQLDIAYAVRGSLEDIALLRIVYNPIPHNTTIARLVKYVQKGFNIDPYQRVFLAELLKSDQYNPDLEISTGYRAVNK